ncbi:hypothetical protein VU01_10708 [Candidatus Electrothrix marina]|uniref:Uncharacterized protein n=1 Tax=Candidatus Electrothrix marina TaxID=1859130 RepID=A0A444JFI3_9BACT|nr:hypothetical protein VU01_10708 [Candidatus Electrothrix marina]
MNKSGSGSATNAGIDYQQRVSALFLIALHSQFDISQILNVNDELNIESISYETAKTVDDLNIVCEGNKILYIQIKRKIALSEKEGSEFQKVIEQFLSQYIAEQKISDRFFLITTSDTSKSIKYDLKKIFDSIRLNDTGFKENPLNVNEKKTYSTLERVFDKSYEKLTKNKSSNKNFVIFCKQVFISIIDVEADMTTEKIAVMLLHSKRINMPSLVWKYLVSQSLYYATNRLSLNSDGINDILARFQIKSPTQKEVEIQFNELLKPVILNVSELSTGKDVFIVESFVEGLDYAIVELFRFDSNGEKRVKFEDDYVLLGDKKAKVIRRFSTMVGLQRYMEENQEYYKNKKVVVLESRDIDTVEETEVARKYKEYCHELLNKNTTLINCIHSGKSCLSASCYFVEVDYPNYPPAIGMVREECLLPLDRILGKPIIPQEDIRFPTEINISRWMSLLSKGQGLLKSLPEVKKDLKCKVLQVGWNEDNQVYAEYNYCIRKNLEDGSSDYLCSRGKIQRFSKYEADIQADCLNSDILKNKNNDNRLCVSSKNRRVISRPFLMKIKENGEEVLEVRSFEVCKYSQLLGDLYNNCDNYYAPLCFVIHKDTEQIFVIGDIVPFISNPFQLYLFIENWGEAGFIFDDHSLSVIHNDYEFDKHMRDIINDSLFPIIDPKFTSQQELEEGVVIRELNSFIEENQVK